MSRNKPTHINLLDHWDEDEVLQRLVHANVSNLINRQFGLPRLPRFDDLTDDQRWEFGNLCRSIQFEMGGREYNKD
jgi:hypothetical protein